MGWESKRRQLNWKLVHELYGPLRWPWRGGGGSWLVMGTISLKACGSGEGSSAGLFPRAAGEKAVRLSTVFKASAQLMY